MTCNPKVEGRKVRSTSACAALLLLVSAAVPLSGCLLVAGAAIGAGVVHALGDSSAEVSLDASRSAVLVASREELSSRGVLEHAHEAEGRFEGTVGGSSVTIEVGGEVDGLVRVTVTARKNSGVSPDLETAEQVAHGVRRRVD